MKVYIISGYGYVQHRNYVIISSDERPIERLQTEANIWFHWKIKDQRFESEDDDECDFPSCLFHNLDENILMQFDITEKEIPRFKQRLVDIHFDENSKIYFGKFNKTEPFWSSDISEWGDQNVFCFGCVGREMNGFICKHMFEFYHQKIVAPHECECQKDQNYDEKQMIIDTFSKKW